jgi:TonB family protein
MSLVVSIARDEPLCIKASADAAAAWGRNEKGYGFWDRGTIEYAGGRSFEIAVHVAVRPNASFAEFAQFPLDLEISGHLNDDDAPVGVFAVKRGKATVAIMVPALQGELEMNLDEPIELDRVVLATGTGAHLRMIVSIRVCSAPAAVASDVPEEAPLLVQAEIPVAVQGTSHRSGSAAAGAGARSSETFIEQTTTAILFAHGAVVRLAEKVAPGQILILKHMASKAESACRVVSVKSNPSAKGFVELEFLQPAPNFWGTALLATRANKSPGAGVARAEPTAVKPKIAAVPKTASPVPVARPAARAPETAKIAPAAAARHVFGKMLEVPAAIGEAHLGEKSKTAVSEPAAPAPVLAESVVVAPEETKSAPAAAVEPAPAEIVAPPVAAPIAPIEAVRSAQPDVAEPAMATHEEKKSARATTAEPAALADDAAPAIAAQAAPVEAMRSAQSGEAMRPAPLDLAMISAPSSIAELAIAAPAIIEPTPETPASDATVNSAPAEDALPAIAAQSAPVAVAAEPAPIAPEAAPIPAAARPIPAPRVEPKIAPARPASAVLSGAGVLSGGEPFAWNKNDKPKRSRAGGIAVAAALILAVAGGAGYYVWQQRTKLDATVGASNQPILAASAPAPAPVSGSAPDSSGSPSGPAPATGSSTEIAPTAKTQASVRSAQTGANAQSTGTKPRDVAPSEATPQFAPGPEVAEMKMPTPTAAARSTNQTAPEISTGAPSGAQDASTGAILSDAAQPDRPPAPPPVRTSSGAQQPRLLWSAAPVYPYAAKAEKVQGDVSVDLLIDESGKVASMTVVSGPALLRQAALDALRHRQYLPAMLDGKPSTAHIVVVVHFQL